MFYGLNMCNVPLRILICAEKWKKIIIAIAAAVAVVSVVVIFIYIRVKARKSWTNQNGAILSTGLP